MKPSRLTATTPASSSALASTHYEGAAQFVRHTGISRGQRLDDRSRMNREVHVRICESAEV